MPESLTQEKYEEQRRRLEADADAAFKALTQARDHHEAICDKLNALHVAWRDQQSADRAAEK